jgi:hypothetical protein
MPNDLSKPHFRVGISLTDKPAEIVTVIASVPIGVVSAVLGVHTSAAMSYVFSEYGAGVVARILGGFWFVGALVALYGMVRKDYSAEIFGVRVLTFAFLIYGLAGVVAALAGGVGSALTGLLSLSTSVWMYLKSNGLAHERGLEIWFLNQQLEVGKRKQDSDESTGQANGGVP